MAFRLIMLCAVGPVVVGASGDSKETAESLPEVESVLSKATDTAQDFAAKAALMQERVAQKHKESTQALADQKAWYEKNLTGQTAEIHSMQSINEQIQLTIKTVMDISDKIKSQTEKLRGENDIMRKALQVLEDKVGVAQEFLSDSLNRTDDAKANALEVLLPPVPEPNLSHFLNVVDGASGPAMSFLQLSSRVGPRRKSPPKEDAESPEDVDPGNLAQLLSESLMDIEHEQKEGEAQLKAHFLKLYNAGSEQLGIVQKEQDRLNDQKTKEQEHQHELKTAREHVLATREELVKRLHGMDVFAERVDKAAANALEEVEGTLSNMEIEPVAPKKKP